MKYNYNGKNINIPDKDLERIQKGLHLSKEEAIFQWLEDEDYIENEEKDALIEKTKGLKIHHESSKPKTKKTRERKIDDVKKNIITSLSQFLTENGYDEVIVTNDQKIIEFSFNGEQYKLDLIKKRKPK